MKWFLNLMIFQFLLFAEGGGDGGAFMGGGGSGGDGGQGDGGDGGDGDGGSDDDIKYAYPEGLDASYHGNATLLKYADKDGNFNQGDIMKSLIHSTSQMGADKMIVPNDKFTSDQWKETFQKLGVPEKIEDYKFDNNLPEGIEADAALVSGYTAKAHELGLLPSQAAGLMEFYNEYSGGKAVEGANSYKDSIEADTAALKKDWGDAYGKNMNIADQALKHFYPDEAERQAVIDTGFLDTIQGTKFFNMLGTSLGEDIIDFKGNGNFGSSPEELDGQIAAVHGELSGMGKGHPQYAAKLKEYNNILAKRHGSTPIGPTR